MEETSQIQSSHNPPAQPTYILRGHVAQIHSVQFFRSNSRILTGDAEGWVVLWDTTTKRAVGVWKAHRETILGVGGCWGGEGVLTHGRDNKLYIWQLRLEDEKSLSGKLPIEDARAEESVQPRKLHELNVNTLNFCEFAMCYTSAIATAPATEDGVARERREMLIATPGVEDGHINITSLPTESRIATLPGPKGLNTGMVMALGLVYNNVNNSLQVLVGYESGHACIWTQQSQQTKNNQSSFQVTYLQKTHAQPILSIGIAREMGLWFTSSADAIVARHPFASSSSSDSSQDTMKILQTKHAGQQGLAVRSDEKIFATAGWDGRMRVYSTKGGMKELAVLKWHGEGCYAVAFADVDDHVHGEGRELVGNERGVGMTTTVAEKREEKARRTHWLAAGSKDGKVSLWEVY